ncbi:MAG TPA: divergent polysaccharide deacetylase family protein [Geminicoccaceae bacterium]|nr:divergent polysaccharide deacetylase family protein [Geminicoccaceae bacterium]
MSAKGQLAAAPMAVHARLERRLRKIARTMPEIGIPNFQAVDASATIPTAPAAPEEAAAGSPVSVDSMAVARIEPAAGPPSEAPPRSPILAALSPRDAAAERAPAWLQNAVAPVIDDRPAIAVVIDDLGLNRKGTEAVSRLDGPLTLSFLPYAANLGEQTRAARAAGHELLVHVPMEPLGAAWPGPNALLSSLEPAEFLARLRSQLHRFRGFVGINNHMGSLLTTDRERMALVMAELRRQDLLFLDSRTTPASVAADAAARYGVPHAVRDVFVDSPLASIAQQLAEVEEIAARRGIAVAIGHPHDRTIEALRRWLPTLEAKGFALVPISTVVARHACAGEAPSFADACAPFTAIANLIR